MCGLSNICSMVVVMIGNMFQVVIFQGHQEVYQGITRNTETPGYITVLQISGYHQKYGNSEIYHGPTNIRVSAGIRKLRDISRSYKYPGITRNTETPRYITVLQISAYHQEYGNSEIYHGPTNIGVSPGIRKLRDISRFYKYHGITRNTETPGYITVL